MLRAADRGRQCFSTTPIAHPNVELITYDDILDPFLPPGLILADEIHMKLGAHIWRKLDERWREKMSQSRKDGHDLLWTSQHESLVLPQVRRVTNFGLVCSRVKAGETTLFFVVKQWEFPTFRRGKPLSVSRHPFSARVANAYDTNYAIQSQLALEEV